MKNASLYKGCLESILLKLLQDNGRMYGYEITQKVKRLTAGELEITEGALYPLLHRLEAENILQVETEKLDNRIRKYYSLTGHGIKEQIKSLQELQSFADTLQIILNPKLA